MTQFASVSSLLAASLDSLVPGWILLIAVLTLFGIGISASGARILPRFRPRFRVSAAGVWWMIIALLLFAVGWLRSLNLVLLLAYLMFAICLFNFIAAGRRLDSLRARRRLAGSVHAGTPIKQEIEVENIGTSELVGVRIVDRGPDHLRSWFVPRLAPGELVTFSQEIMQPRRCLYACEPLRAVSGVPFGLIQRGAIVGEGEDLAVLPKLGQVHRGRLRRFLGRMAPAVGWRFRCPRPQPLMPTEFHGIRPFQRGDSPRWIHWRTSARRGELMVREFEETTNDNLLLVVDPWVPAESAQSKERTLGQPTDADRQLDELVSLAATICWEWCRQRDDHLTLAIAGARPVVVNGITGRELAQRCLEELAILRGSSDSRCGELCDRLIPARVAPGPVLVVSTRTSDLVEPLSMHLKRPVAEVNAAPMEGYDFYQPPESMGGSPEPSPPTKAGGKGRAG